MSQEIVKYDAKESVNSIHSSANVNIINYAPSSNNTTNINIQISTANNSATNSSTIPALSKDEILCLPSSSDPLFLEFKRKLQIVPKLKRNYQTVIIKGYKTESLGPLIHKMFKQLSLKLIHLKFFDCEFDVVTLNNILSELPLLESLELNLKLSLNTSTELDEERLPQLLRLKDFKIETNADMLEYILEITKNASNVELLTFFKANFNMNEFNELLKKHKSLKSLRLTKCIVENTANFLSHIESLHLNSISNVPSIDYIHFDWLKQLETLHLIDVNDELLKVLKSKCINGLKELTVNYTDEQNKNVMRYFDLDWNSKVQPRKPQRRIFEIEHDDGMND